MNNVDVPGLLNAALPERAKGKNVAILSQNNGSEHEDSGFLSDQSSRNPPRIYLTAEDDEFDTLTFGEWRDEGFQVEYIPLGDDLDAYHQKVESLHRTGLGPGERFGIVAYGDAASFCLEHYHVLENNKELKLGLLIGYYPTRIPEPSGQFPSSIQVLVHLAGDEIGVVKHSQMIGIQGKRRVVRRELDPGLGVSGINQLAYPSYTYDAEPGFAEPDLEQYDSISAELAWSRSLTAARRALHRHVNLEFLIDQNIQAKFFTTAPDSVTATYTSHKSPHVTYFPTLTGGIGAEELHRFYHNFFLPNPPSLKLTLVSRTIGADRVVDELFVTFKHTHDMAWILPGVPPTSKRVEVMVVSIVTVRAGRIYHEHIYWDQASVLVQVGLLDPTRMTQKASDLGIERMPVVGRDAARRVFQGLDEEEDGQADNKLIPGWYDEGDAGDKGNEGDEDDAASQSASHEQGLGQEKDKSGTKGRQHSDTLKPGQI